MSVNRELADRFNEIADLLELTGANPFRANANSRAARTIKDLGRDIAEIADDPDALTAMDGIGPKIAEKIREYLDTGKIREREELLKEVPSGLLGVLKIPGLGPKTVRAMWQTLGVESLDDLKKALDDGSIMDVPRMGAKTVENIRKAIDFSEKSGERTPLGAAAPIADAIVEHIKGVKGVTRVEAAGSLRRAVETIGDIDILACGKDEAALHKAFRSMPGVTEVLAAGKTKSAVRVSMEDPTGRTRVLQADLRVLPKESFGAGLLYFTGSKDHNVRLRERALKQGCTLNEYGLFPEDKDTETPPQERGVKPKAAKTEADVYKALGLPFIPPGLREDRGELDLTVKQIESLIGLDDIRAELHAHTTASDGVMSIEELAEAAKARGFHTIAVTDHSRSQPVANGLSVERIMEHSEAVRAANAKIKGITILAGSEVDILADGSLDYPDKVLRSLDVVVASPHSALGHKGEQATKRLLKAVKHPHVNILGHPTGRMIGRREGMTPDIDKVAAAAAEHGVAMEINAHWMRLDLGDINVRAALDAGALIAIDCDVHSEADFDNLRFGVATGRRGWLPKAKCVNTWGPKKLHDWLKRKHGGK